MPRENWIRLSDEEYDRLTEMKTELFGTDEVPYGTVVGELIEQTTDEPLAN